MHTATWRILLSVGLTLWLSAARALAETAAATQPAQPATAPAEWGKPKAGLQTLLATAGPVRAGEGLSFQLRLRNAGTTPVTLGPGVKVFGWLVVAQGPAGYCSQRVYFAQGAADWPEKLESGKEIVLPTIDLSKAKAYAYGDREALVRGYLTGATDEALPAPAGMLTNLLATAGAKALWALYLPGQAGKPLVVQSNMVEFTIQSAAPPERSSTAPAAPQGPLAAKFRKDEYSARDAHDEAVPLGKPAAPPAGSSTAPAVPQGPLAAKFRKDEYSARDAHDEAVRLGEPAVPDVIAVAADAKAPYFARMWAATALADIPDERSVSALIALANDPSSDVRHVVAYHGPKQRRDELDQAILARALGGDATTLAWAVQGFSYFGASVPEALLKAAIESKEPLARAAAAEALGKRRDAEGLAPLLQLLSDGQDAVRAAAAAALGKRKTPPVDRARVLEALVRALDVPGEQARQRICQVLSQLTGQNIPYDPRGSEDSRRKALKTWRDWWAAKDGV